MPKFPSIPRPGKSAVLLVGAVLFGLLATFATRTYIHQTVDAEKARLADKSAKVEVVVAKFNLNKGDVVSEETMSLRKLPADTVPSSAVRPGQFDRAAGSRLMGEMKAGEPLLWPAIEQDDASSFAHRVRNGSRAYTITVDDTNSVSGMVRPGDLVDIYLTAKPPEKGSLVKVEEQTFLLLQRLQVMATGQRVKNDAAQSGRQSELQDYGTVTLSVLPAEAQKLIVAQRIGQLRVTLRNPDDELAAKDASLDASGLFGMAPSSPRGGGAMTEVIVGGKGVSREWQTLASPAAMNPLADTAPLAVPPAAAPTAAK